MEPTPRIHLITQRQLGHKLANSPLSPSDLMCLWVQAGMWVVLALPANLIVVAAVLVAFMLTMPLFSIDVLSHRLAVVPDELLGPARFQHADLGRQPAGRDRGWLLPAGPHAAGPRAWQYSAAGFCCSRSW